MFCLRIRTYNCVYHYNCMVVKLLQYCCLTSQNTHSKKRHKKQEKKLDIDISGDIDSDEHDNNSGAIDNDKTCRKSSPATRNRLIGGES